MRSLRATIDAVRRPPQLLSAHGEKVILAAMPVGLLSVLILGFAVLGAPLAALLVPVPLMLLCIAAVRKDLRHVRRHGWSSGGDGSNGDGRSGGPDEPISPVPPGDGGDFDWDAFVVQFWDQVDRQPVG